MNTQEEILNLQIEFNHTGEFVTVREWFIRLFSQLWIEGEGFNGKRPFGNSGWNFELYAVLIKNNIIAGKLDEYGYVEDINTDEAKEFVLKTLIQQIFPTPIH